MKIWDLFKPVSFLKGTCIVEEGTIVNKVYIIRKGEWKIVSSEIRKLAETLLEPKKGPKSLNLNRKFSYGGEFSKGRKKNSTINNFLPDNLSKLAYLPFFRQNFFK